MNKEKHSDGSISIACATEFIPNIRLMLPLNTLTLDDPLILTLTLVFFYKASLLCANLLASLSE